MPAYHWPSPPSSTVHSVCTREPTCSQGRASSLRDHPSPAPPVAPSSRSAGGVGEGHRGEGDQACERVSGEGRCRNRGLRKPAPVRRRHRQPVRWKRADYRGRGQTALRRGAAATLHKADTKARDAWRTAGGARLGAVVARDGGECASDGESQQERGQHLSAARQARPRHLQSQSEGARAGGASRERRRRETGKWRGGEDKRAAAERALDAAPAAQAAVQRSRPEQWRRRPNADVAHAMLLASRGRGRWRRVAAGVARPRRGRIGRVASAAAARR